MSEMVADSEADNSDQGGDKTFISKLLVEMKSQFNKTESKKSVSPVLFNSYDAVQEAQSEDNALGQINMQGEVTDNNNVDNNSNAELVMGDDSSLNNIDQIDDNERTDENSDDTKEEKPRIVMTFRKPSTSNKTKPKPTEDTNTGRRSLRNKLPEDKTEETVLKRSARRRSKDCNESVLQSAIARKEKSYNESNKPQRLTRQLKPTQKILDNIANAALKLDKNKSEKTKPRANDKQKLNDIEVNSILDEDMNSENEEVEISKKNKHKYHSKHSKSNSKKVKISLGDSDSDQSAASIKKSDSSSSLSDNSKTSLNNHPIKDRPSRRSQRLSTSRIKDEEYDLEINEMNEEPSTGEHESLIPAEPECSSVGAQLIASRLCLCTQTTHIYASPPEDDIVFCTAIDSLNEKLVGCNNTVERHELSLIRPSCRVPFMNLCEVHYNRMLRHNCCPTCGIFCTQGKFTECEAKHHYHRECQISVGDAECCPHCGMLTPDYDVYITLHSKKLILLPTQKAQHSPAKMSFPTNLDIPEDNKRCLSPPLIPYDAVDISINLDSSNEKYEIIDVLNAVKNDNLEKLSLILASGCVTLNETLPECNEGTVLHYAAQNDMLAVVHMLNVSDADLDVMDKDQNTPLITAIVLHKNDVVRYLVKVGANISLKGTDGMTALHLAAKSNNLEACQLLLRASVFNKDYINMGDDGGWTPLIWACEHGHLNVAKYLINHGASPHARDVEQNVALHWAAFSNSSHIIEVLLNNGCDVNAVNVHGETPLHTAARQNNYNSVIMLLARGADVTVINKSGESAIDCALQTGSCYNAIALNVHLLGIKDDVKLHQKCILTNDISKGREINPIQCVNYLDDEPEPMDFVYVSKNCVASDFQIDQRITSLQCCPCMDKCNSSENCTCGNNSLRCWYDEEGRLAPNFDFMDPPMIFECNDACNCNTILCGNRVIQRGSMQRVEVFRTRDRGWGVRSLRLIPKGTFVCEYVGEILTDADAEQREDDSFLFDLDNRQCIRSNENDVFCIDAKQYGNFSRFINHSCEPNLLPVRVFIEHHDLRFPRIAMFASRDILPTEELSFDYGEKFWIIKYKSITCNCGSDNCKYSEETIATTLENYNNRLQKDT